MTHTEALKLALEALENTTPTGFNMQSDKRFYAAIAAIKEALAQPQQRSYIEGLQDAIWLLQDCHENSIDWLIDRLGDYKYASEQSAQPPVAKPYERTWVNATTWRGLTDLEISQLWIGTSPYFNEDDFAQAIEAKLKEKNT